MLIKMNPCETEG